MSVERLGRFFWSSTYVHIQTDTEAGMTKAAVNTTAALTTQPACAITSHTLEFFWYEAFTGDSQFPGRTIGL